MPPSGSNNAMEPVITIGILEVQGAFLEHQVALRKATALLGNAFDLSLVSVRTRDDLTDKMDGLIIPGGESTTISIYLKRNHMEDVLRDWIRDDRHVTWGTCAGMILLSKITENQKRGGQASLGAIDVDVSRNYFGRQVQSFEAPVKLTDTNLKTLTKQDVFPGVFIRAPAVVKTLSTNVNVLATVCVTQEVAGRKSSPDGAVINDAADADNDVIVAVQQGNTIATAFHPELTDDCSWHMYFLSTILSRKTKTS